MSGLNCEFFPVLVNNGAQNITSNLQNKYADDVIKNAEQDLLNQEQIQAIDDAELQNVALLNLATPNFQNGLSYSGYQVNTADIVAPSVGSPIVLWDQTSFAIPNGNYMFVCSITVNSPFEFLQAIAFTLYNGVGAELLVQSSSYEILQSYKQTLTATFFYNFVDIATTDPYIQMNVIVNAPSPGDFGGMRVQIIPIKSATYI